MAQKMYSTVVFGCGNRLLGDDGFGPAVIDALNADGKLPDSVAAIDAGTAVRDYLFDYLLSPDNRPEKIIILSAVERTGEQPGAFLSLSLDQLPHRKADDFSLHQFPGVNLLAELDEHTEIVLSFLAVQAASIPDAIEPGLSASMQQAVPLARDQILRQLTASS